MLTYISENIYWIKIHRGAFMSSVYFTYFIISWSRRVIVLPIIAHYFLFRINNRWHTARPKYFLIQTFVVICCIYIMMRSYLMQGMLSLLPSGVLLPGLAGCCWWGWGEWGLDSEKQGLFSFSDGETTSSASHCRRTSSDWRWHRHKQLY